MQFNSIQPYLLTKKGTSLVYIGAKMINYLEVLVQFKSLLYIIIHYYYIHIIIHIIHYKNMLGNLKMETL